MENLPRPTDAELAILRVLWRRGPSTVKQVHEEMARRVPMVYTTILKQLQIMTEKGLVTRDEAQRAHLYTARLPEQETQSQLVGDLLDRAFEGSAGRLVMRALSARPASAQELTEIRELLDRLEGGREGMNGSAARGPEPAARAGGLGEGCPGPEEGFRE
jgi:predicted transcriptional regulator